jgi:hypothetical protein
MELYPHIKIFLLAMVIIFGLTQTVFTEEPTEMVTFVPAETDQVLNNPYMGWAPSAMGSNIEQPHRLVYVELKWSELEPHPGNYQFRKIERANQFDYWAKQDVKIIMRLVLDKPAVKKQLDIPEWLYDETGQDGTWYANKYGKGFSPNYSNPILITRHKELIKVLAERYNNQSQIAFIELGSIGHWGEWHTAGVKHPFPRAEIADQYVQPYLDYFDRKYLLMRRPMVIARERKLGLYNDAFGNREQTESYLQWINNGYPNWMTGEIMPKMPDFWKNAPSGGEMTYSRNFEPLHNAAIEDTIRLAKLSHLSWLGPYCPVKRLDPELQQNADRLQKTMGYRLVLKKEEHPRFVRSGQDVKVAMLWSNQGTAPFYFDWPFELSLADRQGNILVKSEDRQSLRSLMPGTLNVKYTLKIPAGIKPDDYILCIAVLNPETGEPGIELAIGGKRNDGRYTLGRMTLIR